MEFRPRNIPALRWLEPYPEEATINEELSRALAFPPDVQAVMQELTSHAASVTLGPYEWRVNVRARQCPGASRVALFMHGHGGNCNFALWAHFWPQLVSAGYHLLAFDSPGFGRSTGVTCQTMKWKQFDQDLVLQLLRAFGVPEDAGAVTVFGQCMGGAMFLRSLCAMPGMFAARHILHNCTIGTWPAAFPKILAEKGGGVLSFWKADDDHMREANVYKNFTQMQAERPDLCTFIDLLRDAPEYLRCSGAVCPGTTRASMDDAIGTGSSMYTLEPSDEALRQICAYVQKAPRLVGAPRPPDATALERGVPNKSFRVFVRARPFLRREKDSESCLDIAPLDGWEPPPKWDGPPPDKIEVAREKQFVFDRVFTPTATQAEVYEMVGRPLVDSVLAGHNACLFAYGQTGSGKTYTMEGQDDPGVMIRSIEYLCASLGPEFEMSTTFVQLYNDNLLDLFDPHKTALGLVDTDLGAEVAGAKPLVSRSADEILRAVREGAEFRTSGKTNMNDASSRSHAILSIQILPTGSLDAATAAAAVAPAASAGHDAAASASAAEESDPPAPARAVRSSAEAGAEEADGSDKGGKAAAGAPKDSETLKADVSRMFSILDVDSNGTIDRSELSSVLQRLDPRTWTRRSIDKLMSVIDTTKDGKIQFEELLDWVFRSSDSSDASAIPEEARFHQALDTLLSTSHTSEAATGHEGRKGGRSKAKAKSKSRARSPSVRAASPRRSNSTVEAPPRGRERSADAASKKSEKGDRARGARVFHLVDLAGSERVKRSGASGTRFEEAVAINSALLHLGIVVSALVECDGAPRSYIPYRDSILTRLLQNALGGRSRTALIACVTPATDSVSETLSTLSFASRATHIKNSAEDDESDDELPAKEEEKLDAAHYTPAIDADGKLTIAACGIDMDCYGNWSAGPKAPLVVLLHYYGFGGGARMWSWMFDNLVEMGFRYLAPNFPGHEGTPGSSSSRAEDIGKAGGPLELLKSLVDTLGEKKVILVGFDWGGGIAAEFALTYPKRLKKVALWCMSYRDSAKLRGLSSRGKNDILFMWDKDDPNRSPKKGKEFASTLSAKYHEYSSDLLMNTLQKWSRA